MDKQDIYKATIISFPNKERKVTVISSDEPILLKDDSNDERESARLSISDSILDIFNMDGGLVFFEDEKIDI